MTTAHSGSGGTNLSVKLLWQRIQPPPRGPKPGLTLDRIVTAAVELADSEGLAALSMRRVATELAVGTMTLYRYVPGKGELLDLMLDHVHGPLEELERYRGGAWRATMEAIADNTWQRCAKHPWLLQVSQPRPVLGPNALAHFDFALSALDGLGLSGRDKVGVIMAVEHYVTGTARTFVHRRQVGGQPEQTEEEFWATHGSVPRTAMSDGGYPEVSRLPTDSFGIGGREALEFGLHPLLDGLENVVESRRRE